MKVKLLDEQFRRRQDARGRLPKWLAMLMPAVFSVFTLGTTALIVFLANRAFLFIHPELPAPFLDDAITWTQILLFIPPFMVGVSSSIISANFFLWLIRPVRLILDQSARGIAGSSFAQAMSTGKQALLFAGTPGLILTLLGIWSPWSGT